MSCAVSGRTSSGRRLAAPTGPARSRTENTSVPSRSATADCHVAGVELQTILRPGVDLTARRGILGRSSLRSEVAHQHVDNLTLSWRSSPGQLRAYIRRRCVRDVEGQCVVCQDLRDYLHKGVALDELWKVAKGDIKYADFMLQQQQQQQPQDSAAPPPAQEQLAALPEDMVSFCALNSNARHEVKGRYSHRQSLHH